VGIAAALAASRILNRLVEGMRPADVSTFALTISVLVMAALVASFVPARRASRIDPVTALREQ
jgi:putative ABC transport system permease protein